MSTRIQRLIGGAHRAAKVDAGQSADKSTGILMRMWLSGTLGAWCARSDQLTSILTAFEESIAWLMDTGVDQR